jgi:hypothetical protein
MLGVYIGFCVQTNEHTIQGRAKIKLTQILNNLIDLLPISIKDKIFQIIEYCFFKPNPIIQVNYFNLDYLFSISYRFIWNLCALRY